MWKMPSAPIVSASLGSAALLYLRAHAGEPHLQVGGQAAAAGLRTTSPKCSRSHASASGCVVPWGRASLTSSSRLPERPQPLQRQRKAVTVDVGGGVLVAVGVAGDVEAGEADLVVADVVHVVGVEQASKSSASISPTPSILRRPARPSQTFATHRRALSIITVA
jgi:hypothetical protein